MRHVITSLLVAGCLSSTGIAFQARGDGAAAGNVCALLTRDLVMKVSSPAGKAAAEKAKPIEDFVGKESRENGLSVVPGSSSCKYGRVLLVLQPLAKPADIQSAMRARTPPYKDYEPVAGLGDAAFFQANSTYANLYVWKGSRHFHIEMGGGFDDDAKTLKPNAIALANAILPELR